jgi:hypothetical protein
VNFKIFFLVLALSIFVLPDNASAHTAEIVAGYKIEVGWVNEPPIVGIPNAIEILVTKATQTEITLAKIHEAEEKMHDLHNHDTEAAETEHSNHNHKIDDDTYSTPKNESYRLALLPYFDPSEIKLKTAKDPIWEVTTLQGVVGEIHQVLLVQKSGEISVDRAIRVLSKVAHKNIANPENPEFILNVKNILSEVDRGKLHNLDGLYQISQLIQTEIEDRKKLSSEVEEIVGVTGLANKLQVSVQLKDSKAILHLVEDPNFLGRYIADYTPPYVGFPLVKVFVGTIGDREIEITFHPESVQAGDYNTSSTSDISSTKLICDNPELVLMKKISGDSIACLKSSTAKILEERGWGIIIKN